MYKVILHRNAAKYYRNADKKLQGRINTAIDTILGNPRYKITPSNQIIRMGLRHIGQGDFLSLARNTCWSVKMETGENRREDVFRTSRL